MKTQSNRNPPFLFLAGLGLLFQSFLPTPASARVAVLMGFYEKPGSGMSKQIQIFEKLRKSASNSRNPRSFSLQRNATLDDFVRAWFDPAVEGVVWFGHGADSRLGDGLASLYDRLPDARGADLIPILKALHSHSRGSTKFLALVTCHARTILARQALSLEEDATYLPDGKVVAQREIPAIAEALNAFHAHAVQLTPPRDAGDDDTLQLAIRRDGGERVSSWLIWIDGKAAAIWSRESASIEIRLQPGAQTLTLQSLGTTHETWGEIELSDSWRPFLNPRTGQPYGNLQRTWNRAPRP